MSPYLSAWLTLAMFVILPVCNNVKGFHKEISPIMIGLRLKRSFTAHSFGLSRTLSAKNLMATGKLILKPPSQDSSTPDSSDTSKTRMEQRKSSSRWRKTSTKAESLSSPKVDWAIKDFHCLFRHYHRLFAYFENPSRCAKASTIEGKHCTEMEEFYNETRDTGNLNSENVVGKVAILEEKMNTAFTKVVFHVTEDYEKGSIEATKAAIEIVKLCDNVLNDPECSEDFKHNLFLLSSLQTTFVRIYHNIAPFIAKCYLDGQLLIVGHGGTIHQ